MSEDKTYCSHDECDFINRCDRHPKRIEQLILHSIADLEYTEYCCKIGIRGGDNE